jgi:hypothetical protein
VPDDPATLAANYAKLQADFERERNLWRPAQRAFSMLDEDAQAQFAQAAQMYATGNTAALTEWMLNSAASVSGAQLADLVAQRQNAPTQQQTPIAQQQVQQQPTPQVPGPDEIARLVQSQVAEQMRVQNIIAQTTATLDQAGFPANTPAGQTIVRYAQQTGAPIEEAIDWFRQDLITRAAQFQQSAQQAAAGVPTPSPTGAPAANVPSNLSPRELAMRRAASWKQQ